MLITVCDTPGLGSVNVNIKSTVDTSSGLTLVFRETPVNSGQYIFLAGTDSSGNPIQGYVYFTGNADDPNIPAVNTAMTSWYTGITISVPGTNVPSISIASARTDDDPNWPANLPPAPNQPYLRQIISCVNSSSSGDGICDDWKPLTTQPTTESIGLSIPFTDTSLNVPVTYNYYCGPHSSNYDPTQPLGTQPNPDPVCPLKGQKDIFVEIDWLRRHHPDQSALNAIVQSFANSPGNGIKLHLQVDEEIPMHKDKLSIPSPGGALTAVTDFDIIKTWYFGTYNERNSCGNLASGTAQCNQYVVNMLTAKRQVFHYALIGHSQVGIPTSSGSSELPGNDIFVTLGSFTGGVGSIDQLEGTFMHELGHNLGLYHGGEYPILNPADDSYLNCKPNYLSVMSYFRQFSTNDPDRSLDYSRGQYLQNPLNENGGLDESVFLPAQRNTDGTPVTITYATPDILQPLSSLFLFTQQSGNTPVDYDEDGWLTPPDKVTRNTQANINFARIPGCNISGSATGVDSNGATTNIGLVQLNDYNDWSNLLFNFKTVSGFYDGASSTTSTNTIPPEHQITKISGICDKINSADDKILKAYIQTKSPEAKQVIEKNLYGKPACSQYDNGITSTSNYVTLSQRILNLYYDADHINGFSNQTKQNIRNDISKVYNYTHHEHLYPAITGMSQTVANDLVQNMTNFTSSQLDEAKTLHDSVLKSLLITVTPPTSYPDQTYLNPYKLYKLYQLGLSIPSIGCNPGFQLYSVTHQYTDISPYVCLTIKSPNWVISHPAFNLITASSGTISLSGTKLSGITP